VEEKKCEQRDKWDKEEIAFMFSPDDRIAADMSV
jgi:hypothetical protein